MESLDSGAYYRLKVTVTLRNMVVDAKPAPRGNEPRLPEREVACRLGHGLGSSIIKVASPKNGGY
jgi:hypothetical protein